jgi:hypothetical protein
MIFLRALLRLWFAVFLAGAAAIIAFAYLDHFMPFDLNRPPDFLTKHHLNLLKREPERCLAALDRAKIDYRPVSAYNNERGCGYEDAVRLQDSAVSYGSNPLLRCPAMLGLLLWQQHVLMPEAGAHFGKKLTAVRHLGTYSCRKIGGVRGRSLSQHASANAIDIAGFTLEGGESISLLRDWKESGEKGRFLRAVRDGACRIFGVTLSPDFNAAHANHFHFDMGTRSVCR